MLCLNRVPADIVDIKPANMEELTEVITAAEFHPHHCNVFVYSSSKGTIRLCDMRSSALCDRHSKCKCLHVGTAPRPSCFQMLRHCGRRQVSSLISTPTWPWPVAEKWMEREVLCPGYLAWGSPTWAFGLETQNTCCHSL